MKKKDKKEVVHEYCKCGHRDDMHDDFGCHQIDPQRGVVCSCEKTY
jgi:hypothetical protein